MEVLIQLLGKSVDPALRPGWITFVSCCRLSLCNCTIVIIKHVCGLELGSSSTLFWVLKNRNGKALNVVFMKSAVALIIYVHNFFLTVVPIFY